MTLKPDFQESSVAEPETAEPPQQLASTAALTLLVVVSVAIALVVVWAFRARQVVDRWQPPEIVQPTMPSLQTVLNHVVANAADAVSVTGFDGSPESVALLCSVERLRVVRLDGGRLDAAATRALGSLPHLEQLHLRGVQLDDAALDALQPAANLRVLNLAGSALSAAAIERLQRLPQLRQLRLQIAGGDATYATAVSRLQRLRAVHLIDIAIDNETLKPVAELPHLESLYIDEGQVTDEGWIWLFDQKPQLHVHIDQRHHDRDPQKH